MKGSFQCYWKTAEGMLYCFFVSSLISFINILQFSGYKSFTSLVKFILKYFTLSHATVK